MDDLIADALDEMGTSPGPRCGIARKLEALRTDGRADLAEQIAVALGRLDIEGTALARALRSRNVALSHWTINRHRRGDCSCAS